MKKNYSFIILMLLIVSVKLNAQTNDTVINGKKYNTIIYYNHFNFKGGDGFPVIVYGNMKDAVKHGNWLYTLPNGTVIAKGKFKDGYKTGYWKYADSELLIHFTKKLRVKDCIIVDNTNSYKIIDYISKNNERLLINGNKIPTPHIGHPHFL